MWSRAALGVWGILEIRLRSRLWLGFVLAGALGCFEGLELIFVEAWPRFWR